MCNKIKNQKYEIAFSALELIITMVAVSVIACALISVVTKNLKSRRFSMGGFTGGNIVDCSVGCETCLVKGTNKCKTCAEGYYVSAKNNQFITCTKCQFGTTDAGNRAETCSCPPGKTGKDCSSSCNSSCYECSIADASKCITCALNYYASAKSNPYVTCSSCQGGGTADVGNKIDKCKCPPGKTGNNCSSNCNAACYECTGTTNSNCISCAENYYASSKSTATVTCSACNSNGGITPQANTDA